MAENQNQITVIVGAVIATVLQIVLAPNIAIASIVPNFMMVFCIVVALLRAETPGYVLPFVLGMLFDLLGGGPVGGMAFLLILVTFVVSRVYSSLNNDTVFMLLVMLFGSIFVVELLYGVLLIACGMAASPLDALIFRSIPCTLYDCLVGLVLYPIVAHFMRDTTRKQETSITTLR